MNESVGGSSCLQLLSSLLSWPRTTVSVLGPKVFELTCWDLSLSYLGQAAMQQGSEGAPPTDSLGLVGSSYRGGPPSACTVLSQG